jgi:biopolymer transport protein ExbD
MRWVMSLVIALAACAAESPLARLVIEVSADGTIALDGKPATVNDVLAEVKGRSSESVEVRADSDAIWMHVQWVLAALGEAGFTEVRCVFHSYPSLGFVKVPVNRGGIRDQLYPPIELLDSVDPLFPVWIHIAPEETDRIPGKRPRPKYHIGSRREPEVVTRNPRRIAWRARKLLLKPDAVGAWIHASSVMSYESVMELFVAMRVAGAGPVHIGMEALHPWDRDLPVLPAPQNEEPPGQFWFTDRSLHPLYPVNLPVAHKAVQDKDNDPDDRVILNLTANGRLILVIDHEPVDTTLAELRNQLAAKAREYGAKMEARGEQGFESLVDGSRWSKLFVLLRADQDVPWRHVRWVMAELLTANIYKLQFGARIYPGEDLTPKEAERKWAGRDIEMPFTTLEGKLALFLPTRPDPLDVNFMDVVVGRTVEGKPARYTFGAKTTEDAETLTAWFDTWEENQDAESKIFARLRADPRTSIGAVIFAVNCFKTVGIEKVTLLDVKVAPDEIRKTRRLPR